MRKNFWTSEKRIASFRRTRRLPHLCQGHTPLSHSARKCRGIQTPNIRRDQEVWGTFRGYKPTKSRRSRAYFVHGCTSEGAIFHRGGHWRCPERPRRGRRTRERRRTRRHTVETTPVRHSSTGEERVDRGPGSCSVRGEGTPVWDGRNK